MAKFIPRLYCVEPLATGVNITATQQQTHYLLHVLRAQENDTVLLFNAHSGEFSARLAPQKNTVHFVCKEQTRTPEKPRKNWCVALSILKPDKFNLACEKVTELGATKIIPLICDNTQHRTLNMEKTFAHMIDAAEQCDRLDVPTLANPKKLTDFIKQSAPDIYAVGLERLSPNMQLNTPTISGCIIGPEGGFSAAERTRLQNTPNLICVTLGDTVLRAETAAIALTARLLH